MKNSEENSEKQYQSTASASEISGPEVTVTESDVEEAAADETVEKRKPTLAELLPEGGPLHFPGMAGSDFSGAKTDGRLIEL